MKYLTALNLIFVFSTIGLAQNINPRRPFQQISFSNYQPVWYTTLQDSSLIDNAVRRNHLNGFNRNEDVPDVVVDGNLFYNLFILREADYEGSYLGSIDLKTGKRLWHNYFSLSTQDRQEFTQSMILENGKIELLGMKTQSLYGSGILEIAAFDSTCWMTKRVYDKYSGNLLVNHQSNPFDTNTQRLAWASSRKIIKYSQIFKINDTTYRYVHHNKVRPENTLDYCNLDEKGVRLNQVQSISLGKRYDSFNYFHLGSERFLMIEDDFKSENNKYTLHFLNGNFDTLRSVRTLDFIKRDSYIKEVNKENEFIIIISTKYEPSDTFKLYPERLLWVIDFDGNTLKKIKLEDNKGKSMLRYAFVYDRPSNELLLTYPYGQGLFEPPKSKLQFYKSLGNSDELQLKYELAVEDSIKVIYLNRMTKTPEGNLIVLWSEYDLYQKDNRYDDSDIYSVATSYICFDPKTLGLVSSVNQNDDKHNIKVYPNPTNGIITLGGLENDANVSIYSITGQLIRSQKSINNQLDISDLKNGVYLLKFDSGSLREIHKVVKIN